MCTPSPPHCERGRPQPLGGAEAAALQLTRGVAVVEVEQVAGQLALHEERVADRGGPGLVEREAELSTARV